MGKRLLKINLLEISFFIYILSFGFFGSVSPNLIKHGLLVAVLTSLALSLPLFLYKYYFSKYRENYAINIEFDIEDLCCFSIIGILFFSISSQKLGYSLFNDELSYAQSAHGHSITIASIFSKYQLFLQEKARYLIQVVDLVIVLTLFIVWLCVKRLNNNWIFTFLLLFFFSFRLAFILRGGNGNPHPPGELLPILLSGTFLGITELGLKFGYFAGYLIFLFAIFKISSSNGVARTLNLLSIVSIGSIPLVLDMSTVIEHALWGYIFFTIFITIILLCKEINYPILISIISIGTLFRQSVFLLCVPAAILFFRDRFRKNNTFIPPIKEVFILLAPCLIFLPILVNSLLFGTPATESLSEAIKFNNALNAFTNGFLITQFNSIFPYFYWVLFILVFIPFAIKDVSTRVIILILFLSLILVYFSINTGLWKLPKYQAEYIAPFIVGGILSLRILLIKYNFKIFCYILIAAIAVSNLTQCYYPQSNFSNILNRISQENNYSDAYREIRKKGLENSTLSIGYTYGVFPEVINDYTLKNWFEANSIYLNMRNILTQDKSPEIRSVEIDKNHTIDSLLIFEDSTTSTNHNLITNLRYRNWEIIQIFPSLNDESKIVHLVRKTRHE